MSKRKVMGYIGVDPSISHPGIAGVWDNEIEERQIKIAGGAGRPARLAAFLTEFCAEVEAEDEWAARDVAREARYDAGREHVHILGVLPAEPEEYGEVRK